MGIKEALIAYLLARPGLTALVSNRIHLHELPQGSTLSLPAVVILDVSNVLIHTHEGQLDVEMPIKQFTAYGQTQAAADAVADQLKLALNDYHGTLSGLVIQKIELQSEGTDLVTSSDGTVRVCTADLEYEITYEKE